MDAERTHAHSYMKVLRKRWWAAVTVFLVVVFAAAAATFMMKPMYKATALVYIDPGYSSQVSFQQSPYPLLDNGTYLQTQIGVLRSESIAGRVVDALGLERVRRGRGGMGVSPEDILSAFGVRLWFRDNPAGKRSVARGFLEDLEVSPVRNSNLVKVSYSARDPQLAADAVNATVRTFIEQNLEMKVTPAREAMSWLNDKLGEIKKSMTASTSSLQDFKRDKELIVTGEKQSNISLQALSELTAKVLSAEARRYEAEASYQQVKSLSFDPAKLMTLPAVINNRVIQELKSDHAALSKQYAELSKKYGAKHPQMIRLASEMDSLQAQIAAEVGLIVTSLKNDYQAAQKAESSLKAALARQKTEAMSYERRSTEYELMRQDVEGAREIYDAVLKKFQETNLMGNVNMSNVQLIDAAVPPNRPDSPKKALNILLGVMMGVTAGVAFAFLAEYLDDTFKSPEDIEENLGLAFLGMVPRVKELMKKGQGAELFRVTDPKSNVAESFRNIRSNILLSAGDTRPQVIQTCSALHSEGKSMVSVNLAHIMAAAGDRVVLVDADMRKPSLHRAMAAPNTAGLSSVLSLQAGLDGVIKNTNTPGLDLITSGPVSPNPGELLGSRTMRETLAELRARYDRVIVDCPPFIGISDAGILTPLTDGVLLVVRNGRTTRDLAQKTRKGLEMINARILGVVLNDTPLSSEGYYYQYNYGYYYGEKRAAHTSP